MISIKPLLLLACIAFANSNSAQTKTEPKKSKTEKSKLQDGSKVPSLNF